MNFFPPLPEGSAGRAERACPDPVILSKTDLPQEGLPLNRDLRTFGAQRLAGAFGVGGPGRVRNVGPCKRGAAPTELPCVVMPLHRDAASRRELACPG